MLKVWWLFQVVTKRIGRGMHEWAAKIDEYARGMVGPAGSTLFEELGLYYIGPVDGHNIEDLLCVLHEVASLNSMGPVLVHVITKEDCEVEDNQTSKASEICHEGLLHFSYFLFNSLVYVISLCWNSGSSSSVKRGFTLSFHFYNLSTSGKTMRS